MVKTDKSYKIACDKGCDKYKNKSDIRISRARTRQKNHVTFNII
jgi:hypothetical protein